MISEVYVSDRREVRADVSGVEPLCTPKGDRPINPRWVRISYRVDPVDGSVRGVWFYVGGTPVGRWARSRRHPDAALVRSREYDPATAPAWVVELVTAHTPS